MGNRRKHTVKKVTEKKKAVKVATSNNGEFNGLEALEETKKSTRRPKNDPEGMTFAEMKAQASEGKGNLVNKLRGL